MIFGINRLEPGRDGIKQSAFSSSQGEEKNENICPLNQLISPPPWTLGKKAQPNNLIAIPVLSPSPLPNYSLRPLAFKNSLKPVKLFCRYETYSSLQSYNNSYFKGQLGFCARKIR